MTVERAADNKMCIYVFYNYFSFLFFLLRKAWNMPSLLYKKFLEGY